MRPASPRCPSNRVNSTPPLCRRSLNWVQIAFFRLNAVIGIVFLAVTLTEIIFPNFRVAPK